LKGDGTRAETSFSFFSAQRMSPFNSAGASVQSTTGSRVVRISGSNAGYTMFRGSVKGTGYPLHSPVSTSLPLRCVTVCHHISIGVYQMATPVCHVCTDATSAFCTVFMAIGVVSLCVIIKIIFKFYSDDGWGIYICDQPLAWAVLSQDTTRYRSIL